MNAISSSIGVDAPAFAVLFTWKRGLEVVSPCSQCPLLLQGGAKSRLLFCFRFFEV